MRLLISLAVYCLLTAVATAAEPLHILAWNIVSGGSDPDGIEQQLNEMDERLRSRIFALSNVPASELKPSCGYGNRRPARFLRSEAAFSDAKRGDARLMSEPRYGDFFGRVDLLANGGAEVAPGEHPAPLRTLVLQKFKKRRFVLLHNQLASADTLPDSALDCGCYGRNPV